MNWPLQVSADCLVLHVHLQDACIHSMQGSSNILPQNIREHKNSRSTGWWSKIHHRTSKIKAAVIKQLEGLREKKPTVTVFMWHISKTQPGRLVTHTPVWSSVCFKGLNQKEAGEAGKHRCKLCVKLVRKSHVRFNWDTRKGKTAM